MEQPLSVGPRAACQEAGERDARTVRATAAAVGLGAAPKGHGGGMALEREEDNIYVYIIYIFTYYIVIYKKCRRHNIISEYYKILVVLDRNGTFCQKGVA